MLDWLRDLRKSAETRREERTIAYVDGQLLDNESKLFEQEMASDSALREDVAQLRRVKSSLRTIPRQRVPYNFTLDPAVYGKPEPAYGARAYPMLQGATAFAALVFVIMATLTLSPFGGMTSEPSIAYDTAAESAPVPPMAEPQMAESLIVQEEAVVEEAEILAEESASDSASSAVADDAGAAEVAASDGEVGAATAARSFAITVTATVEITLEMAADDAATDADSGEESEDMMMADEAAPLQEAPPEPAITANEALPTISLTSVATPLPQLAQMVNITPTVAVTVSQAAPNEVTVINAEDPTVEQIQTIEPAPQPAQRSVQPLLLWTIIIGSLFVILLVATLIIRRQL